MRPQARKSYLWPYRISNRHSAGLVRFVMFFGRKLKSFPADALKSQLQFAQIPVTGMTYIITCETAHMLCSRAQVRSLAP